MKIAVFDVCGTLYDSNTTFDFLDNYFHNNKKYSFYRKISKLFLIKVANHFIYKFFKIDMIRVYGTSFLKDIPKHDIEIYCKNFVNLYLAKKIKKDIVDMLKSYQQENYHIVLMSGSYEFIIKDVGKYFDVDSFYASKLDISNNIYTGKYEEDILLNKHELLKKQFPIISELVVVSDNRTDLNLMLASTKAFAVSNKKKHTKFWEKINSEKIQILEYYV